MCISLLSIVTSIEQGARISFAPSFRQTGWMLGKVFVLLVALSTAGYSADVNVLIIGSTRDTSDHGMIPAKSVAFSPTGIQDELQKILAGANLGTVNVVLEDRHKSEERSACYNLASWFHWPYPADVETTTRWPNLRGEKGTKWDYVVLFGDSYTIEYMPGLYTHGVAKVAEEVAKGPAETILLMPWPGAGSESTVDHYREVVYRTGRTGGFKVAPAGLAWQAAGKPVGETHPGKDGAYIAAASVFSRIWNKSAKASAYVYDDALADSVHKTVTTHIGAKQYAGKANFQSPFRMFSISDRVVQPRKSGGGTSTEDDLIKRTNEAEGRSGVVSGRGPSFTIGRSTKNPKGRKDYRNRGEGRAFGYFYQFEPNNADPHVANIVSIEMHLGNKMLGESKDHRLLPRRLLLGGLLQHSPEMRIKYGTHVYGPQATAMGTYIYTIVSGRCPMDPKPDKVEEHWNAQKVGYEAAWRLATCQTRAPGLKIMPSAKDRHTVDFQKPETMTVRFLMPPKNTVTVAISSDNSTVASVSPKTLIFTPSNYTVAQMVSVKVADGMTPGTELKVDYATSSDDEVYDGLSDSWRYHINAPPAANDQKATAFSGKIKAIALAGSDPDGEALSYSVVTEATNGSLTILPEGVAAYTAKVGYAGVDSFTFRSHDGSVHSKPAKVTVTVREPTLYDSNLLEGASGELKPFTKYKWMEKEGKWKQGVPATDGVYVFAVDSGKTAELYQDVDVRIFSKAIRAGKQSFKISGYVDDSNDDVRTIMEFRDSAEKILSTYDTGDMNSGHKLKLFESTELAPVNTASIRVRLLSVNKRGSGNGGRFDDLKLVAIKTAINEQPEKAK